MNRLMILWFTAASFLTFLAFGIDKQKAVRGKWRIRESTLLFMSLIGGAAGGMLGMILFRHKTRKTKFIIAVPVMLAVQLALLLFLARPDLL